MRTTLAVATLALAGCAGSPVWYANHPDNKRVDVDDVTYTVVPHAPNLYAAYRPYRMFFRTGDYFVASEKLAHIQAVESITKCKAIASEAMVYGIGYLVTVQC